MKRNNQLVDPFVEDRGLLPQREVSVYTQMIAIQDSCRPCMWWMGTSNKLRRFSMLRLNTGESRAYISTSGLLYNRQ